MAVTVKVAVWPWLTLWETGGTVMRGGLMTVRIAEGLITEEVLLTTTSKDAPLSAAVVGGVV